MRFKTTSQRLHEVLTASRVQQLTPFVAVGVTALIGGALLFSIRAAGPFVAAEPEQGTFAAPASIISDTTASGSAGIKFGTATSGGACAVTTQHVPDGPDGMGGCWPGPSNTGPNAPKSSMSAYAGSCTVTAANTTIDSKVINCAPLVVGSGASGLLIKNSYLNGGVYQVGSASYTLQDSLLDNAIQYPACSGSSSCPAGKYACGDPNNQTVDCGVSGRNFTILRTEIINTNRAAYCESTCTIQDSYFHGTNLWPDVSNLAHASSVRNEQYLTLRHNALGCDFAGPYPNDELGCSADMSGYPDFAPIMHATIDGNLFLSNNVGAGFCAYAGGTAGKPFSNDPTNATYIVFQNNVFQRGANGKCGTYGPVTDFITGRTGNVWTNNKYDNGATVNPE
jgi:hypothetical protein